MKKRTKYICIIWIVILGIMTVGFISSPKRKTLNFFHTHKDILTNEIRENKIPTCSVDITCNFWDGDHPIMEYIVESNGIVPSSKYCGFFYSYDGIPVSFQNSNVKLVPISENKWEWHDKGDNHGYVEWLEENWFYFEASF